MRRLIRSTLWTLLCSVPLWATNGDHLIGVGPKARAMGGVGIGAYHGAESLLINPAMIGRAERDELFLGATVFMPDVQSDIGGGYVQSKNDLNVIPGVSYVDNVDGSFFWGIGALGTAGMGVDYRGSAANLNMYTKLELMQFAVPLVYRTEWFSFGVTPVAQYGRLKIRYTGSTTPEESSDFNVGYQLGIATKMENLCLGAVYKSAIDMTYEGQLSTAMFDFTGIAGFSDHLEQPYEIGIGIGYRYGRHKLAVDYKVIGWEDAAGYKSFGWQDQKVYILGYEYQAEAWAVRTGYNHAKSPIRDRGAAGAIENTLNLLGFPAIVEDHYTFGFSKNLGKDARVDVAYTYAPNVTQTYQSMFGQDVSTRHAQRALTIGIVQKY